MLGSISKITPLSVGLVVFSSMAACDHRKVEQLDTPLKNPSSASCNPQSGNPSYPCRISLYRLLAVPLDNVGSLVSVRGYLSRGPGGNLILFVDRESSEYAIRENGIHISAKSPIEIGPIDKYVEVVGKFSAGDPYADSILDGTRDTIGSIEADSVNVLAGDAWSCSQQDRLRGDQPYLRADPCPLEESRRKAGPAPPLPADP